REMMLLARSARAWMKKKLGMEMPPCPMHLEHAQGIASMNGKHFVPGSSRPIGFLRVPVAPEPTLEGADRGEIKGAALFLEHGSPRSLCYGVAAHELTHLWQARHWPIATPLVLREGLAMWVEYQALLAVGAIHNARDVERHGDPLYA